MLKPYQTAIVASALMLLFIVAVAGWQRWTLHREFEIPVASYPISQTQTAAAEQWLARFGYSPSVLRNEPISERAKRINYLTYNFCKSGRDNWRNPLELYQRCESECAGIVYFYRGLATALGIETRLVNFYAIPMQQDHTAVEVKFDDGRWGFVDPTYGAIFTDNGRPSGTILSISDVLRLSKASLVHHVVQARKHRIAHLSSMDALYGGQFIHQGMVLENYQDAEAIAHDMPNEVVSLEIPITANDTQSSIGAFDSNDPIVLRTAWEQFVAESFAPRSHHNATSPVAAQLSNDRANQLTIFTIDRLVSQGLYRLQLRLVNETAHEKYVQIGHIGRAITQRNGRIVAATPGVSTAQVDFTAHDTATLVFVHNLETSGTVYLYAARLIYRGALPKS